MDQKASKLYKLDEILFYLYLPSIISLSSICPLMSCSMILVNSFGDVELFKLGSSIKEVMKDFLNLFILHSATDGKCTLCKTCIDGDSSS